MPPDKLLVPAIQLVLMDQQDLSVPNDQYYQYGVRLQATVPIYQNGSEWSVIRQAKQLVGQRRNELDSARRQSAEAVIRSWRQLDSARSRVTSFEAQVKANEVALNGVRQEALVQPIQPLQPVQLCRHLQQVIRRQVHDLRRPQRATCRPGVLLVDPGSVMMVRLDITVQ